MIQIILKHHNRFLKISPHDFLSSHYSSILSIHLSQEVSGTYQSAFNASKNLSVDNIEIIDSKTLQ